MPPSQSLYFEDLTPGTSVTSGAYRMSAEEIIEFAQQYDPQPFHTDAAAAQATFFQGLAASGWHTGAVTMRLLVDCLPVSGGLVGAGLESLRWFRPVRADDELHLTVEVLSQRESKSRPAHGWVRARHTTFNQNDEPVQEFTSTILVPKRPVD